MDPIAELTSQVVNIRDNHLKHLADDVVTMKLDLARVTSDVKWLMIIGSFIIIESTGILIAILIKK